MTMTPYEPLDVRVYSIHDETSNEVDGYLLLVQRTDLLFKRSPYRDKVAFILGTLQNRTADKSFHHHVHAAMKLLDRIFFKFGHNTDTPRFYNPSFD